MKTQKLTILILFIIVIAIAAGLLMHDESIEPASSSFYLGYFSQVPPNYDELLRQTYGESPHFVYFDNIKLSVEKVVSEKYFIVYSWVTGDQSYFAINTIIEDTEKNELNKENFGGMHIKDDIGNTYLPLPYYSIIDYPPDQPLGWKQILYVKFYPLEKDAKTIDIFITYKGEQKVIENVSVQ